MKKSESVINYVIMVAVTSRSAQRSKHRYGRGRSWRRCPGWSNRTQRHHCDVSSKLCCPSAKPPGCAPPLVSRFGIISRE